MTLIEEISYIHQRLDHLRAQLQYDFNRVYEQIRQLQERLQQLEHPKE